MSISVGIHVNHLGEVTGEARGIIVEECTGVCENLGLTRRMIMEALEELDEDKNFVDFYLTGYTRTLTPIGSVTVVDETEMPQLQFTDHIENNTRRTKADYVARVSRKVETSGSVTWSSEKSTTVGFKVGWNWTINGSGGVDWKTSTGKSYTYQDKIEVSACRELNTHLEPGDSILVTMRVDRRVLTLEQRYRVDISGTVVGAIGTNKTKTYALSDVLEAAGKKSSRKFTATAVMDCFTNARITLRDC